MKGKKRYKNFFWKKIGKKWNSIVVINSLISVEFAISREKYIMENSRLLRINKEKAKWWVCLNLYLKFIRKTRETSNKS